MWQAGGRKGCFMNDAQTIFIGQSGGGPLVRGLLGGLLRGR